MLLDRALHPAALFLFAVGFLPTAVAKPKDAILLSDVQSLTLRADRQTSHRRVPAAPQLKCVSHRSVCGLYKVDVMRCTNQGSSYGDEDIQWSCTAELPPELKLGSTEVICEGYSSPQDPYILKGSCGVEYKLILTDEGHRRHPDLGGGAGDGGDGSLPVWVFWVFFTFILVVIVYSACFANQDGYDPRGPYGRRNFWGGDYWGGGGGGGGGGGRFGRFTDPPPPYPGTKTSSSGEGWRPGFWSGLAGGTAAGYYAGSRGRNNNTYDGGYGSFGGRGSTWGGSGGAGPSRSDSSSSSGARYESTGFGSTSRR